MAKGTMAECPKCGARVKKDNLRRHIAKVHTEGGGGAPPKKAPRARAQQKETVTFPWRVVAILAVVVVVVLAAYWVLTRPSSPTSELPVAEIVTNYGTIRVQLDTTRAPNTAGNFINLARAGRYDGSSFHRVAVNFVIQGGQMNPPASEIAWERTNLRNYRYTISMARVSGNPNSATSQFFINLRDNPNLDAPTGEEAYPYVVFGIVVGGTSVVDAIGSLYPTGQTSYDGAPTNPDGSPATVTISRVTIVG